MKRLLAAMLALALAPASILALASCGKKAETERIEVDGDYPWLDGGLKDSSDIPTWEGQQLALVHWNGQGVGGDIVRMPTDDVVTPEITRVTGVSIDYNNSFDNAGQTADVKLAQMIATKSFPSIVAAPGNLKKLVEADLIYDLTDYMPVYGRTALTRYPASVVQAHQEIIGVPGRIYVYPYEVNSPKFSQPELSVSDIYGQLPTNGMCLIRDDILKMLYPSARTQDEIEALYMQNGGFTEEEIFDVPIKSAEDFVQLLYDIQALGLMEGTQKVYPTYAFAGGDNWDLMQNLWSWWDGWGGDINNTMFTYWDKATKQVELTPKQGFFKNDMKIWNQLVLDDVASQESLTLPRDVFVEKMNNGLYALTYGANWPDGDALKLAGKDYRYRRLFLDIPINRERFLVMENPAEATGNGICIFKDSVKEEDLPQILRWMDFQISEVGDKLMAWGPRSAGLFDEGEDGRRSFKDPALADYMVYGGESELSNKYNLISGRSQLVEPYGHGIAFPAYYDGYNKYSPQLMYEKERSVEDTDQYFESRRVRSVEAVMSNYPAIWSFANLLESVQSAWESRPAVEAALTKVLAAPPDGFEAAYQNLLATLEQYGWDDDMMREINETYREINAKYMDSLLNN
ncbi:MAG: hypothetical protein LBJ10_00570 [Clostridiales bacterium]|jgi:hypothetical protein|nr:hypothetical protein [Clostridiales bacterium]